MDAAESRYIERKAYLSRYTHERTVALREHKGPEWPGDFRNDKQWLRSLREELPRFIPFLQEKCGLEFRGRILEIGAGGAWLSAELSKLPRVVEVFATDFSPKLLKEEAPRVFRILNASHRKITRTPCDFHRLDFPDKYFDFVVCSAVLHYAANMVQVLREVKRVLKPGGQLVAVREPVRPLMKLKSRARKGGRSSEPGAGPRGYTLADYKEMFRQASLPMEVKRVTLSSGFKYYFDKVVNGLTHARYAFVGTRRGGP